MAPGAGAPRLGPVPPPPPADASSKRFHVLWTRKCRYNRRITSIYARALTFRTRTTAWSAGMSNIDGGVTSLVTLGAKLRSLWRLSNTTDILDSFRQRQHHPCSDPEWIAATPIEQAPRLDTAPKPILRSSNTPPWGPSHYLSPSSQDQPQPWASTSCLSLMANWLTITIRFSSPLPFILGGVFSIDGTPHPLHPPSGTTFEPKFPLQPLSDTTERQQVD